MPRGRTHPKPPSSGLTGGSTGGGVFHRAESVGRSLDCPVKPGEDNGEAGAEDMWSDNTSTTASPDLIRGPLSVAVQLIGCE
jgi:hypothetical protein